MSASRITRIHAWAVTTRVRGVFRIALGEQREAKSIYVLVELGDGTRGWGEGAPAPSITGEHPEASLEAVKLVAGRLIGLEPLRDYASVRRLLDKLLRGYPAARAALESALLDAVSRSIGAPLCTLLNGCGVVSRETSITISLDEPSVMAGRAREAVSRGFRRLKVKLGGPPSLDYERVRAVREAVGEGVEIIVDVNQGWGYHDALRLVQLLHELGVVMVEQPLPARDLEALAELSKRSPVPIAVDESVMSEEDVVRLYSLGFRGVVNVKVSRVGGPERAARLLELAERLGLGTMVGCMLETSLGVAHALHASSATSLDFTDLDAPLLLEEDPADCVEYRGPLVSARVSRGVGCEPRTEPV